MGGSWLNIAFDITPDKNAIGRKQAPVIPLAALIHRYLAPPGTSHIRRLPAERDHAVILVGDGANIEAVKPQDYGVHSGRRGRYCPEACSLCT